MSPMNADSRRVTQASRLCSAPLVHQRRALAACKSANDPAGKTGRSGAGIRGAHAPSRVGVGALADANFFALPTRSAAKMPLARAPKATREGACAPRKLARPQRATASALRMVSRPFQVEVRRSESELRWVGIPGTRTDRALGQSTDSAPVMRRGVLLRQSSSHPARLSHPFCPKRKG